MEWTVAMGQLLAHQEAKEKSGKIAEQPCRVEEMA